MVRVLTNQIPIHIHSFYFAVIPTQGGIASAVSLHNYCFNLILLSRRLVATTKMFPPIKVNFQLVSLAINCPPGQSYPIHNLYADSVPEELVVG